MHIQTQKSKRQKKANIKKDRVEYILNNLKISMKSILCIIAFIFCMDIYAEVSAPDQPQLNKQIDALSTLLRDPYASEFSRNLYLSSDKQLAIVVLTLSGFAGGNGSSQTMAVFARTNFPEIDNKPVADFYSLIDYIQIGAKGWRFVESKKLTFHYDAEKNETVILVPFAEYDKANDPLCCPTVKGNATYRIDIQHGNRVYPQLK